MTYPIYFKMWKYVTNLYLYGTEVTLSFAAFGGSCASGPAYSASVVQVTRPCIVLGGGGGSS